MPEKVASAVWRGYVLNEADALALLGKIQLYESSGVRPFYQSESHRKTYYDSSAGIYIKITDEKTSWIDFMRGLIGSGRPADLYFRHYQILVRLGVGTPELMACFKVKTRGGVRSVIATREIKKARPLDLLLESLEDRAARLRVIRELARISALIHRAGYYFSLDLRNILAVISGVDIRLFVIDLEHMKYAGRFAGRRIRRNLSRFKNRFFALANSHDGEFEEFNARYKSWLK
jgi:hypothetical protein